MQAKYRELTSSELKELEKEFIDYLIVNGITAEDWVRIKEAEKEKAEDIITLFSDVILEGVLRKVKFLEIRSKSDVRAFQCLEQKMVLVGMTTDNPEIDFTDEAFFSRPVSKEGIKVYTTEKAYTSVREEELFKMIQSGCQMSDGQSFKAISLALVE
ncbi:DUF6495 family protein [Marinoscillum sp.]|uniref:DUF6495 family protein n=1 Tax=Marinoscillum sp. TaxID=2024838 RepID=UPI003BAC9B5C